MRTLEIRYHLSGHKGFEYFYQHEVLPGSLKSCFPAAPSYNRFAFKAPGCWWRLSVTCTGACSSALKVCHNRRIHCHPVFSATAKEGQCAVGGCYGFKLFLVVNGLGQIVQAFVTPANVADHGPATLKRLFQGLTGLAFADKGFASQKAFTPLFEQGLKLITYIRFNMNNKLLLLQEKMLLKKRGMIESVIDIVKSVGNIEHTRHRSPLNMIVDPYAALCAYSTFERKPSIFVR